MLACTALVTRGVNAGLVGLVLSYGLNTTSSLVRQIFVSFGLYSYADCLNAISELVCTVRE